MSMVKVLPRLTACPAGSKSMLDGQRRGAPEQSPDPHEQAEPDELFHVLSPLFPLIVIRHTSVVLLTCNESHLRPFADRGLEIVAPCVTRVVCRGSLLICDSISRTIQGPRILPTQSHSVLLSAMQRGNCPRIADAQ